MEKKRTTKYLKRLNQILDVSEKLYFTKGYEASSVQDIINEMGIAKGTFYHYFKSKEETLEAIVYRRVDNIIERVKNVKNDTNLNLVMKLMYAFLAMKEYDDLQQYLLDELHQSENILLHQKHLQEMIVKISPIITEIIDEGVEKKLWRCSYPKEYIYIFMVSSLTLTDHGLFSVNDIEQNTMMISLISLLEKMLEVESGSFVKLYKQFGSN